MTTDLLRSAAAVHAWLDEVGVRAGEPLDDAELGSLVGELERIERRVASARLRVLAAASKADTAHRAGAASTSAWVATLTTCDPRAAFRDVRLAEEIEESPTVGQALGSGAISSSHATVIMNATRLLPSQVTPAQRVQVEESLVEKARTLSPSRLRVAARRALGAIETDSLVVDAHENELLEKEETSALARASLSFRENGDGTGSGHFTLPTLQFGILRKVVETITAPRRGRLGASQAQAGRPPATDWDHARGLALVELIEHLPTDHLHPATAATVVVTMDESVLQGRLRAAGVDTGERISAAASRRLACGAGLVPAVLGGASIPLDLGHKARLFSDPQRMALGIRHQTCAADGCERPYAWCELQHWTPWKSGGRTDLDEAVPLCGFHHRRVHDREFTHARLPDGTVRFTRREGYAAVLPRDVSPGTDPPRARNSPPDASPPGARSSPPGHAGDAQRSPPPVTLWT